MNNKRELIFHATLEIIKEHGFNSNIKISDIAVKANIGKGTIYEYFTTKDELLMETILYLLDLYRDYIIKYTETNNFYKEIEELINRIIEINYKIYNIFAYKDLTNLLNKEFQIKLNHKMKELKVQYFNFFDSIVKKGVNEKVISDQSTPFEIAASIHTMNSMCSEFVNQNQVIEDSNKLVFIDQLKKLLIKMLS